MKEFFIFNSHYEPPFFDFFIVSRKSEKCNALVYIDYNLRNRKMIAMIKRTRALAGWQWCQCVFCHWPFWISVGIILTCIWSLYRRPWRVWIVPEVQARCGWSLLHKPPGWRPRYGNRATPAISLSFGFLAFRCTRLRSKGFCPAVRVRNTVLSFSLSA